MEARSFRFITADEALRSELSYIAARRDGTIKSLSTGWPKFDSVHMNGLELGWIVLIGGISGSGKTALQSMLESAFFEYNDLDIAVLNFTFEMSARRLIGRKLSAKLQKSVKQLYSADMFNNVSDMDIDLIERLHGPEISKYDVSYVETPSSIAEMAEMIHLFISRKPAKTGYVITLDHSLLTKGAGLGERGDLAAIGTTFNDIRKIYPNCLFIIISQLNRDIESQSRRDSLIGHYPIRSDFYGSDSLYHMSDAAIVIHRPEQLNIGVYGPEKYPVENMVYCHHLKVRDGDPAITVFQNRLFENKLIEI